MKPDSKRISGCGAMAALFSILVSMAIGCSSSRVQASGAETTEAIVPTVGITTVTLKPIERQLTVSSELVPFQEIDVYAKESGYITDLRVDYGTRVKKGDLMAVLEIPELQQLIAQDEAAIRAYTDQVKHAENELKRIRAQYENIAHPYFTRLKGVADKQPGLIAQQEVDDAQGKDLAAAAAVDSSESTLLTAQSQLEQAKA